MIDVVAIRHPLDSAETSGTPLKNDSGSKFKIFGKFAGSLAY